MSEIHTGNFMRQTQGAFARLTDLGIAEVDHRVANSLSIRCRDAQDAASSSVRQRPSESAILSAEARVANIARFHTYLHQYGIHERVDLAGFFSEVLPKNRRHHWPPLRADSQTPPVRSMCRRTSRGN